MGQNTPNSHGESGLVKDLQDVLGLSSNDARELIVQTCRAIGQHLTESQRSWFLEQLAVEDVPSDSRGGHDAFTWESVYARLAELTGANLGAATERCQVVSELLVRGMPESARTELANRLPPPLVERLTQRHLADLPSVAPMHPAKKPGSGSTLADGRPGSRTPLSEAVGVQANSVVLSDNPHGDRKVSSAQGSDSSVAVARPGSKHPLSESDSG